MYQALVASCAETGDMLDAMVLPGACNVAKGSVDFILEVVRRCRGRLGESVIVRMDAGFPEPGLLSELERQGVPYVARIRNNAVLDRIRWVPG